jgi:cell division protein FtsI (penicillin-binding protein 3)
VSRNARKIVIKESTGRKIIEQSRIRLLCLGLFFILCFVSISFRMVDVAVLHRHRAVTITVVDPDNEKSEEVSMNSEEAFSRGNITDRNGMLLATSLMTASMFANPKEIKDPDDTAKKLERALGLNAEQLIKRLKSDKSFVWIKRNLTPREQQAANAIGIPGLYFLPEEKRIYPYGNLLSHVVGYVGIDNKGLAGIEKYFDRRLQDGILNHDALALSIDVRLQAIMREEIKKAVEQFQAIGATGMILDIQSGELLSMVSLPDFDPQRPGKASDAARFNRASLGAYEMGSTFKSFTMAMALDNGTVTMKGGYDATNPLKISSFTIQDSHPEKRWLTVPEIYAYSSNIGTAKMALDVGGKKQKAFLENVGMMKPVEIELPEKATPLYPSDWKEINTVTISYGQGISVSPLHLVRGVAGLVNDGVMPRLTLVKGGNVGKSPGPRVISEKTSKDIRRLMRLVVDHGTGSKADVPGYRVGGKTGTAEKVMNGGYKDDAKLASFIATFPVDDPKYVMLVMIDEPKGDKSTYGFATGGWISAPTAGSIISRMGPLYGMKPVYDVPEDDAEKFWVNRKSRTQPTVTQAAEKKYLHAVSY